MSQNDKTAYIKSPTSKKERIRPNRSLIGVALKELLKQPKVIDEKTQGHVSSYQRRVNLIKEKSDAEKLSSLSSNHASSSSLQSLTIASTTCSLDSGYETNSKPSNNDSKVSHKAEPPLTTKRNSKYNHRTYEVRRHLQSNIEKQENQISDVHIGNTKNTNNATDHRTSVLEKQVDAVPTNSELLINQKPDDCSVSSTTISLENKELETICQISKWPNDQITAISKLLSKIEKERLSSLDPGIKFCEDLDNVIRRMPGCGCRLYGSYRSGYAIENSDINIELCSKSNSISNRFLNEVVKMIEKFKSTYFISFDSSQKLNESFIRIIEDEQGLYCKLRYLGPGNYNFKTSEVIRKLIEMDPRVRTLIIAFRHWTEICNIHEADNGRLHPLCYVLMVIHFLQKYSPPVLPIVTIGTYPDGSHYFEIPKFRSSNMVAVGELWLSLFEYYDSFNWREHAIVITSSEMVEKANLNWKTSWIGIGDVFDKSKNLGKSVKNPDISHFIQMCFSRTYGYFSKSTNNLNNNEENDNDSVEYWDDEIEGLSVTESSEYNYSFDKISYIQNVETSSICSECEELLCICENSDKDEEEEKNLLPPIKITPDLIKQLDKALIEAYKEHVLEDSEIESRKKIVQQMERYIQKRFRDAKMELMGSSLNGFGFKKSDMDICLTFKNKTLKSININTILKILRTHLRKSGDFSNVLAIFGAKIPLIQFMHCDSGLRGDISLYNLLAVCNTQLLRTYSRIDERCRILGCIMKLVAKNAGLANTAEKSLSSYSYILLIIYFLQRTNPPILPALQELPCYDDKDFIEGWNTWFYKDLVNLKSVWPHEGKNTESIGDLWIGILTFFTNQFDYNTVISIRNTKSEIVKNVPIRRATLFNIQDPFIEDKNLGCLMTEMMSQRTFKTLLRAYKLLNMPSTQLPKGFKDFKEYLFDSINLTDGRITKVIECDLCGKLGHSKAKCARNNFNGRGRSRILHYRGANNYNRINFAPYSHFNAKF